METFKDIPNYKGVYQVSDLGRVKSFKFNSPRILKPYVSGSGYLSINLCTNGNRRAFGVSVLVAMAFLEHNPNGHKVVVDHINGNKKDNRLENLQLISSRENVSKELKGGTSKYIGVGWHKRVGKWCSKIWIKGKRKHLGYFDNEEDARDAYQNALHKLNQDEN